MTKPEDGTAGTSGDGRADRATYSRRLSAGDVDPGARQRQAGTRSSTAPSRTDTLDRTRRRAVPEATARSGASRRTPLILPPAKIDATLAAQAAEIKRAVAEARGETTAPPAAAPPRTYEAEAGAEVEAGIEVEAGNEPLSGESDDESDSLVRHDLQQIDDLFEGDPDDFLSQAPDHVTPRGPRSVEGVASAPAAAVPMVHGATGGFAPDQEVAEAAAGVIAAMRSVEDAHARHLEAIELEAARRCELLTAQSELDAELIRLHARREAHAIVSAAKVRTGEEVTTVVADQLSDIGETFSRFAESIERSLATGPSSPDDAWD